MTLELELRCSGLPGAELLACPYPADVRLDAGRTSWRRPLCADCALELEARGAREGFRVAFVELEAR